MNEIIINENILKNSISILPNCKIIKTTDEKLDINKVITRPFERIEGQLKSRKISDIFWIKTKLYNDSKDTLKVTLDFGPAFFSDLFIFKNNKFIKLSSGISSHLIGSEFGKEFEFLILPNERQELILRIVFDDFNFKKLNPIIDLSLSKDFKIKQTIFQWNKKALFALYVSTLSLLLFAFIYGIFQINTHNDAILRYYLLSVFINFLMIVRVLELNLQLKIFPNSINFLNPFQSVFTVTLTGAYVLMFSKILSNHSSFHKGKKYLKIFELAQMAFLIFISITTLKLLNSRSVELHNFNIIGAIVVFNFLVILVVLYNLIKMNNDLFVKYLIYGFLCTLLGYIIMFAKNRTQLFLSNKFWEIPSIYACFGIILEILFFIYALNQRSLNFELDAQKSGQKIERNRIASELHDNVNGILASIKVALQAHLGFDETYSKKLNPLLNLIDKSIKEVRLISHNLLPIEIEKKGLDVAIQSYINTLTIVTKIKFNLNMEISGIKLSSEISSNLYNIFLEIIQNIQKHASATEVTIELNYTDSKLNFSILDNGCGFDKENINFGMGFNNLEHRAKTIGAKFDYFSEIGKGSIFYISLVV